MQTQSVGPGSRLSSAPGSRSGNCSGCWHQDQNIRKRQVGYHSTPDQLHRCAGSWSPERSVPGSHPGTIHLPAEVRLQQGYRSHADRAPEALAEGSRSQTLFFAGWNVQGLVKSFCVCYASSLCPVPARDLHGALSPNPHTLAPCG